MNHTLKKLALLAALLVPAALHATADWPTGDQIAKNINARDEGLAVSRNLRMETEDRRGKQRVRETRNFRKYYGKEKRTAIFYLSPKSVEGTAFLTYDYPDPAKEDDQWLYLPATRRVRRISASDRGDSFLGTDFTYQEIKLETRVSTTDYTRRTIGEDEIDGRHVYTVESTPVDARTERELGVGRRIDTIDSEIWILRKSEQWDPKGKRLKTIRFKDIRKVEGIWTPHVLEAVNHKTGHSTRFTFSNIDYQDDMDDYIFTQQALRRGP